MQHCNRQFKNHIISDYRVMLGKPVIKGTRITVELILRKMAEGATVAALLQMYPHLTDNDIFAALGLGLYLAKPRGTEQRSP